MIIDKLKNSDLYAHNDALKAAFDYLKSLSKFPAKEGRIEIRGDEIFANIDRYMTKPERECRMEAHRKYIDIQVLFSGREIIAWNPVTELDEDIQYDEDKDVGFYKIPSQAVGQAIIRTGMFMLLFPEDAHMPQIAVDDIPESVEKIVMKIAVKR